MKSKTHLFIVCLLSCLLFSIVSVSAYAKEQDIGIAGNVYMFSDNSHYELSSDDVSDNMSDKSPLPVK